MSPPGEQAITTLDGTDEAEDASPKSEGLVGQALKVASKLLDLRNPLRSGIEPTGRCERVPNLHRVVSSGLEPRPEGGVTGTYPVLPWRSTSSIASSSSVIEPSSKRSSSSGPTWLRAPVSSSPRRNERPVDHVAALDAERRRVSRRWVPGWASG